MQNASNLVASHHRPLRTSDPTWEPVTVRQARHQVRLPETVLIHDDQFKDLIQAARQTVEDDSGFIACDGEFTWQQDCFPAERWLRLPIRNTRTIEKIEYIDSDGVSQEWDANEYSLSAKRVVPMIVLQPNFNWPTVGNFPDPITITFRAGYGLELDQRTRAFVPQWMRQACLAMVAKLWVDSGLCDGSDMNSGFGGIYDALRLRQVASYL